MKKIFCILLAAIMIISLSSCSSRRTEIDYGESDLYSLEEREMVANMIVESFEEKESNGYKLKKLEFYGDSYCSMWLETHKKQDNKEYEGCIVFKLTVSVPKDDIFYSEGKIREYCHFYLKEPDGEWYYSGSGW